MNFGSILNQIEYFKVIDSIENALKESSKTATDIEKINLLKLNIFCIKECAFLASKITECFKINCKSLNPIPDSKIISLINSGFDKIPVKKHKSLNTALKFNAAFRVGTIEGITKAVKEIKDRNYSFIIDDVYNSQMQQFHNLNELNTELYKNIIEGFYPTESDPIKLHKHLNNKLDELKNYLLIKDIEPENKLIGFKCKLHPDTVKEIFNLMANHKPEPQIKGEEQDFMAIFSDPPQPVQNPVEWLILHGEKANNSAFHAFLRLMLDCRNRELTRATLIKANKLFTCQNKPIYPNDEISYPGKGNEQWMKSSIVKHFSKISSLIEKQDQR